MDLGVSPYSGAVFHETPLIIYLFHFLIDYAELVFMITDALTAVALYFAIQDFNKVVFKKQKLLLELDQYAPDVAELIRTPMEMRYIPLKVALFYLLNPYTVLSCVAKSTCAINNTLIAFFILATIKGSAFLSAIFLALATYQSLYPITLFVPGLLYLLQRQYIPVKMKSRAFWIFSWEYAMMYMGSLVVIICLSSSFSAPGISFLQSMASYFLFQISLQTLVFSGTSLQRCLSTSASSLCACFRSTSSSTPFP